MARCTAARGGQALTVWRSLLFCTGCLLPLRLKPFLLRRGGRDDWRRRLSAPLFAFSNRHFVERRLCTPHFAFAGRETIQPPFLTLIDRMVKVFLLGRGFVQRAM